MEFLSNDGRRLETLADWRDRGAPVSTRRWAEGGSARELARAWIEGDAAAQVTALLGTVPEFAGLVLQRGVAEKATPFGQRDLLVTAGAPGGTIVVGVQGMADELSTERVDVVAARVGREALDRLTTAFFDTTLDLDPLLAPLRYQLLSGLAGTLADAREQGARRALFLVHEFETPWTKDEMHRRNADDLEAFVARLMPGVERAGDERAWIAGPRQIAGDGTWLPEAADAYVAKLVTSTRPTA